MKSMNFETGYDILTMFALSNDEMISVRGGDPGEPEPTPPPIPIRL